MRETLEHKVLQWAASKDLLRGPKLGPAQGAKTLEEAVELLQATISGDLEEVKDGIGDVLVTLIIQASNHGLTLDHCLQHAYDQIKDRRGSTVNGTFVKEE
jgi:NTP pyrophosphatase (non-canonical NTP hydrolase)